MKKQKEQPVMYWHIGLFLLLAFMIFILIIAVFQWYNWLNPAPKYDGYEMGCTKISKFYWVKEISIISNYLSCSDGNNYEYEVKN